MSWSEDFNGQSINNIDKLQLKKGGERILKKEPVKRQTQCLPLISVEK